MLSDEALLAGFEAGTLPLASFDHRVHVRVAWVLLGRLPPDESLHRMCAGLRQLTERAGHPEKFHATITWAYHALIAERRRDDESFEAFCLRTPELFDGSALRQTYSAGELHMEQARRTFVLPMR